MITGCRAFNGKSQASLIHAILGVDPPRMSAMQALTPPALDHVVQTCLEKDAADRWQSAHDLLLELKWIAEGGSQVAMAAPLVACHRIQDRLIGAGVATVITGLLTGVGVWMMKGEPARHVTRFAVMLPQGRVIHSQHAANAELQVGAVERPP